MVSALVLGLIVATGVEGGGDPHLRTAPVARVTTAPLPSGLPLVSVSGTNAFGSPRSHVDGPGFRSLLLARRFEQLTAYVERLQVDFERDATKEQWIHDAAWVLGSPDDETAGALEDWVAAAPESFAPQLASGIRWMRVGMQRRGGGFASETRADEFIAMKEPLDRALRAFDRALNLRPRAVTALTGRIHASMLLGDRKGCEEAYSRARQSCPSCYLPRSTFLMTLTPKWFGSYEAMERFVRDAPTKLNPRFARLAGQIEAERRDALWRAERYEDAAQAADRAVALDPSGDNLWSRASLVGHLRGRAAALRDLDAAIAAEPLHLGARAARATELLAERRWEEAGRDVLFALRTSPMSTRALGLLSPTVLSLAQHGIALASRGQRGRAISALSLACDLSPEDPDLAARLALLGRPRQGARPASARSVPATPLVVTGVFLDAAGRPVAGARVIGLPSRDRDDVNGVHPLKEAASGTTDAEGRFSLSLRPGPTLIVAEAPGEPAKLAAVGLRVADGHTGPLTISFGGDASIQGRVEDHGGAPVAGVQIRALLDEPAVGADGDRTFGIGVSGSDGSFKIAGLAPGHHRIYAKGSQRASVDGFGDGQRVETGSGSISVKVGRVGFLRGQAIQAMASGPPIPLSSFWVRTPQLTQELVDAPEGRFEVPFRMAWAGMPVILEAVGRAPVMLRVDTAVGEAKDLGTLTLDRGRTVRGRVVLDSGKGLAGAIIRAGAQSFPLGFPWARTDAEGRFTLEWLGGASANIHVQHADYKTKEVSVVPGETVEIRLSTGRRATFRVEDVDGRPLGGVPLRAIAPGFNATCRSGHDGRCIMTGLGKTGDHFVDAGRVPGDSLPRPLPRQLTLPATVEPEFEVTIRYPRVRSRAVIRITDPARRPVIANLVLVPGSPEPGRLFAASGEPSVPHFRFGYGSEHEIDDLAPGAYTALATVGPSECAVGTIRLSEGATSELELTIGAQTCRSRPNQAQ